MGLREQLWIQVADLHTTLFRLSHQGANNVVRFAKRHAFKDQIVRQIGRADVPLQECSFKSRLVEGACREGTGQGSKRQASIASRSEYWLFVLLKFAPVAKAEAFFPGVERGYMANEPGRLTPDQLSDVRVFLLRHHAGAGRISVGKGNEPELGRTPNDNFLTDAAEMHTKNRQTRSNFHQEIATCGGIE